MRGGSRGLCDVKSEIDLDCSRAWGRRLQLERRGTLSVRGFQPPINSSCFSPAHFSLVRYAARCPLQLIVKMIVEVMLVVLPMIKRERRFCGVS